MVYYIKVTPEIAKKFSNVKLRNKTKDGNVLLWIGDLNPVPGDTIAERAGYVGGALLTPEQARDEYFGDEDYTPAECHTPDYYKSEEKQDKEPGDSSFGNETDDINKVKVEMEVKDE